MKKYTYGAYDWRGHPVEISVIAESKGSAAQMVHGIIDHAREFIDIDEGISLNNEEDYK